MKKSQKGFTIIEVALVLAVGAMIFLVVFLAVPALQRNSRNDARKRDVSSVVEAIADYSANNAGDKLTNGDQYDGSPVTATKLGRYLDKLSNNTSKVTVKTGTAGPLSSSDLNAEGSDTISIYTGVKCKGNEEVEKGSARSYAVVGVMENASTFTHYCSDAN